MYILNHLFSQFLFTSKWNLIKMKYLIKKTQNILQFNFTLTIIIRNFGHKRAHWRRLEMFETSTWSCPSARVCSSCAWCEGRRMLIRWRPRVVGYPYPHFRDGWFPHIHPFFFNLTNWKWVSISQSSLMTLLKFVVTLFLSQSLCNTMRFSKINFVVWIRSLFFQSCWVI